MAENSNFLETNDNVYERKLKIVQNELEENLQQYFGDNNGNNNMTENLAPPRDYKVVTPQPGFCLKCFKTNTNEKFFINVCKTDEIPAPEDITEEQLTEILNSEQPSDFRIPMSISEPRIVKDKSNNSVDACDIAINPKFFLKIEKLLLFKEFFSALIVEALSEKYNIQINMQKSIILKNRKFIGTLVSHRVRNSDVKTVLQAYKLRVENDNINFRNSKDVEKKLVQEINQKEVKILKDMAQQSKKNIIKTPAFKLRAKIHNEDVKEIQAEFYLPKCISSQDITLDIGEDRILLESVKYGYLFDKFVNYQLVQNSAKAIFDKTHKMLQIRIPVLSS